MRTLAILALAVWVLATVIFEQWKRTVRYPDRTDAVRLTGALYELTFAALAIWVIVG